MKLELSQNDTTRRASSESSLVMPPVKAAPSALNPLSPFRAARSLAGCVVLSVSGMLSATAQAGTTYLPWRAQWGHPTLVTVTGQGQTHVMTYKQFFDWVGKGKHPNERGIKVVGVLPPHIAAERTSGAQPTAQAPQGQPSAAANYAAWVKYQQYLQRYHYEMAQHQAKVAAWHNSQAQAAGHFLTNPSRPTSQPQQQPGTAQGGFSAAVKSLGQSLASGWRSLGGQIKHGLARAQYPAQPQTPRAVTPQRAATSIQPATGRNTAPASAPPQSKANSGVPKPSATKAQPAAKLKESSAPTPGQGPKPRAEPSVVEFDVAEAFGGTSILVLPKRLDGDPIDATE